MNMFGNEAALDALFAAGEGEETTEEIVVDETPEEVEVTEDQDSTADATVAEPEDGPELEEKKTVESVPYGRFQEVNERAKSAEQKNREFEARLAELEAANKAPEVDEYDSLFEEDVDTDSVLGRRIQQLEARLARADVQEAQASLQAEVNEAITKYPGVSSQQLYDFIARDPNLNAVSVAKSLHDRDEGIRQAAIEAYKASIAATKPTPPVLPKSAGAGHQAGKKLSRADALTKLFG